MRLFFYDHTGANGKAFACVDVLGAHTTRRKCQSNSMLFVEGFQPLERKELGIQGLGLHGKVTPSHANRLHSHDAEDRKGQQAADAVPLH